MSTIEPLIEVFEHYFPVIVLLLIGLCAVAIRSIFPKKTDSIEDYYIFEKGNTDYFEPPRPHSEMYRDYLHVALMSTSNRQQEFAILVSKMIKEHIEEKPYLAKIEYSQNLASLLSNPKKWLQNKDKVLSLPSTSKKNTALDILYLQYVEIFTEVEQLLDINLLSKLE